MINSLKKSHKFIQKMPLLPPRIQLSVIYLCTPDSLMKTNTSHQIYILVDGKALQIANS